MIRKILVAVCVVFPLLFIGCSTKVTRVQSDSVMDLSGRWNDSDLRLASEEIINDALSKPWLNKWQAENRTPTVIVGRVRNKTSEHINVDALVKEIERALLNSGKVDFVASKTEREDIREEREDQQEHASAETRKDMGEEHGAELMMIGSITSITDQEGKTAVVYYQIDMELVDLETNRKVWSGGKKIKKLVERSSRKF